MGNLRDCCSLRIPPFIIGAESSQFGPYITNFGMLCHLIDQSPRYRQQLFAISNTFKWVISSNVLGGDYS